MFYFDKLNGKNILKSTLIEEANAFFTTREVSMTDLESFHCQKLIAPQQTHSDNVKIVNNSDEYNNTDSLILTEKDILICLKFADCTPLIFYDRENNAGAVAHAGWRGTAKKNWSENSFNNA